MNDGKEAASAATPAQPPINFQDRLAAEIDKWRAEGCPHQVADPVNPGSMACGARPHLTKMDPKNAEGDIVMHISCAEGHDDVWQFVVPEAEMQVELKRQADAAKRAQDDGGKMMDPTKASVRITLDLKTQNVTVDPWVPTPGMGLQLAAMLHAYFAEKFTETMKQPPKSPLVGAGKKIVHPHTGKPLVS